MRLRELVAEVTGRLRVTDKQRKIALGNKQQIHAMVDPQVFLELTVRNQSEIDHIKADAKSLLFYNRLSKNGEILVMPFLAIAVTPDYAKVVGHEGRHRAAAMIAKGAKLMPVNLELRPAKDYTPKAHNDPRGYSDPVYSMTVDDLPEVIYGQYTDHYCRFRDDFRIIDGDMLARFRHWEKSEAS